MSKKYEGGQTVLKKVNKILPSVTIGAVLILGMGVPSWAAPERGGATPEEVFNRFNAGAEAQNWKEIAACISPDGLAEMNAMMVVMGGMMVAFANMGEEMAESMGDPEQAHLICPDSFHHFDEIPPYFCMLSKKLTFFGHPRSKWLGEEIRRTLGTARDRH